MLARIACTASLLAGCRQLLDFEEASSPDDANGPPIDAVDATPDSASLCPVGYQPMTLGSTSQYRISSLVKSWISAAQDCADDEVGLTSGKHTHLIVLDNDTERLEIGAQTPNGIGGWIGLSDRVTEGVYLAVTNQLGPNYPPQNGHPWALAEPNGSTNENCVALNGDDALETLACTDIGFFACECDDSSDEPANY